MDGKSDGGGEEERRAHLGGDEMLYPPFHSCID